MPAFYDGQQDYIDKLNEMYDAFESGPYAALPLTGGELSGPLVLQVPLAETSGGTGSATGMRDIRRRMPPSASQAPRWVAKLAAMRKGGAHLKVPFIGDSTTSGIGANGGDGHTDSRKGATPAQMAKILRDDFGIEAHANSVWGDGFEGMNITVFEPKLTLGTGWHISNIFVAGGHAFQDSTAASPPFGFNPDVPTDTLEVYFVTYPGYAEFVVSSGGGYLASGATAGPSGGGVGRLVVTRTLSSDPWVIQKSSATPDRELVIFGCDAYNSANHQVSVWNMGASGSTTNTWTVGNEPYNFKAAIQFLAPDLSFVNLGINNWAQRLSVDFYEDELDAIMESCLVTGSVMAVVPIPSNIGTAPVDVQATYIERIYRRADARNLPLIDMTRRWIAQAYMPDRGLYYDGDHGSSIGYNDCGWISANTAFRLM